MDQWVLQLAVNALPFLFAITLHEAAHGIVAARFGDPTARQMGRVTLNPLAHIDPVGTILLPMILLVMNAGFLFGWARPVPVVVENLRNPRWHGLLVAAAGPLANFLQIAVWSALLLAIKFTVGFPPGLEITDGVPASRITAPLAQIAVAGLAWNVALGMFNLLPILPLDGGRVLAALLPPRLAYAFGRLEPYGLPILFVILFLFGQYLAILRAPFYWLIRWIFP